MLRDATLARVSMLTIVMLLLAACGGSAGSSDTTPAATATAGVATMPGTGATPVPGSASTGTPVSSALVISTAPAGEPVSKGLPTGTAPTAAPPALPTSGRTNFDSDGDGFYTFEEFQQAVAALYPSYVWPERYRVDPDHLLDGYAEYGAKGSVFEVGGEYTIIGMRHSCAWEMTWLDAYRAGDTALMEQSLEQLRTVALNSPMSHQSVRDHLRQMIDAAELGDPALMQQDVTANCQGLDFITPPATPPA